MWQYIIIVCIWIGFILHWTIGSIPKQRYFEIYAGCGIGICLTLLIFSLAGWFQTQTDILALQILSTIGSVLYILAIIIAVLSLITLRLKGKPKTGVENTTIFIETGIFKIIRHPLYLGLAFWSISFIFLIQLIPSTILGIVALFCFIMAAKKEDEFNIKKFGNIYNEYIKKIPMWNVFKGLRRKL